LETTVGALIPKDANYLVSTNINFMTACHLCLKLPNAGAPNTLFFARLFTEISWDAINKAIHKSSPGEKVLVI
jgi:hypothetical protein